MNKQSAANGILLNFMIFKGFALLLTGLILVFFPQASLTTLVAIVGIYWLIDGVSTVVKAITNKEKNNFWGVFTGVLGIIAGILILSKPYLSSVLTTSFFMWLVGLSALIYGFSSLLSGMKLKKGTIGKHALLLGAFFSIIFGIALISSPYFSALTIIYSIGFLAIFAGLIILLVAFNIKKRLKEII